MSGTASAAPVPCFQCGVCCIKWQPLLSAAEVREVAASLGLSVRTFNRRYTRPYPLRRGWRHFLRGDTGGCVFLRFDGGRSLCSIYEARPRVCRDWTAGLDRRECIEGLSRIGDEGLLPLETLYPDDRALQAFVDAVKP